MGLGVCGGVLLLLHWLLLLGIILGLLLYVLRFPLSYLPSSLARSPSNALDPDNGLVQFPHRKHPRAPTSSSHRLASPSSFHRIHGFYCL